MSLHIDQLAQDDLSEAQELSTSVGWNQTYVDWQRLLDLFPETCFAGHVVGELVATSSLATYRDRFGWVGMVLVDSDHRRLGYGSAMFERALECGLAADLDVVGLDATDAGRRVYDEYGFERIGGIDRWRGNIQSLDYSVSAGSISDVDPVVAFDTDRSGADRGRLLEHLLDSETVIGLRVPADGEIRSFTIVRPGRTCPQVGPLVVTDLDALTDLLAAVSHHVTDEIVIDALDRDRYRDPLEQAGLSVSRSLHRMTYNGATPALDGSGIVAATGFPWG
jgi:GNAT superfamily N-acetyltransferase